ncbi:carbamoyltransferase HypF [Helicobacter mustelae]|uniref:Carbamoyltransferase n=1 Tax=Helicobacter mustelae (strain ATCC 43772 / CCUG 25715 / CIP 103759 / LMG 18044 / NCTC 12198 / R85-136P) TaxID=679897 RepID=D3UHQ4_HELM1|nr:carbamoyltransferase HypF [Helicobacter mustelae]CBG40026.1 transcriptional regulatory protein hypF [Helicobacter mustelae 12198]SQH71539.1 transcriptional regulatory protein hypF [Helicobacter mustelae]
MAFRIFVFGRVQGVGFRPHVYKLATKLQLKGYVRNEGSYVEILIDRDLERFLEILQSSLPKSARITKILTEPADELSSTPIAAGGVAGLFGDFVKDTAKAESEVATAPINHPRNQSLQEGQNSGDFSILDSRAQNFSLSSPPPQDLALCKSCKKDLFSHQRFSHYALTTCSDCGPRYSILQALPYDREHTSMRDFPLCEDCARDFKDPKNRRFHAQTLSCKQCPIPLQFFAKDITASNTQALAICRESLRSGKILAIKGVGGFALICDARNQKSIASLRERKTRPHKPFALMAKDLAMAKNLAFVDEDEENSLSSKEAPIVLLKKKENPLLSKENLDLIAPGLAHIGIILPYSALHVLLLEGLDFPIIFTSANKSGEPIIHDYETLCQKLGNVVDGVLDYGREIKNPIEDSLVQKIAGKMRILRLARGFAPLHVSIPQLEENSQLLKNSQLRENSQPDSQAESSKSQKNPQVLLGMGAEQKVTVSYREHGEFLISPTIGDLDNPESLRSYEHTLAFLQKLYQLRPTKIISDKHPSYHSYEISANYSAKTSISWEQKLHHLAHFHAIFGDAMLQNPTLLPQEEVLGVIWDGTGLGENLEIWGGEFFLGNLEQSRRWAHFQATAIYGGERAAKEIYKIAYSFAKAYATPKQIAGLKESYAQKYAYFEIFDSSIDRGIYGFFSTSVGRMFDALAALCEICEHNSYNAQAPLWLEALYQREFYGIYAVKIEGGIIDVGGIFAGIFQDLDRGVQRAVIATKFIDTLIEIIFQLAQKSHVKHVLFSGGVFMNKALCEGIVRRFVDSGILLYFHLYLPSNDANISFGQVMC